MMLSVKTMHDGIAIAKRMAETLKTDDIDFCRDIMIDIAKGLRARIVDGFPVGIKGVGTLQPRSRTYAVYNGYTKKVDPRRELDVTFSPYAEIKNALGKIEVSYATYIKFKKYRGNSR